VKVSAYCPLLYGREYLRQAIDSVADFADKILILYTDRPSYGHDTDLPNPDSEESLRACVEHLGSRVTWHRGSWNNEGDHRNTAISMLDGSDLILPFDSDEIWQQKSLARCIEIAKRSNARNFLIQGWYHFWRSLHWACQDVWGPVRIIKPHGIGDETLHGTIFHCGYSQAVETIRYKMSCHGHHNEIRPEWFDKIFLPNRREDCHPVVKFWWNAKPLDPSLLPQSLKDHPNFGKLLIE
jgi:hypothetical protein